MSLGLRAPHSLELTAGCSFCPFFWFVLRLRINRKNAENREKEKIGNRAQNSAAACELPGYFYFAAEEWRLLTVSEKNFYVHESAFADDGCLVGEGSKIWHFSHISSGCQIGKGCTLGQNVFIAPGVTVGDHCKIQNNVSIYEGVELGNYVFCGPSMVFTNVPRPRCKYPQRGTEFYVRTPVGEGASIGANATIVCGHSIGAHAFIAAGSVVTKDVPAHAIMMGSPARQRGWACECGETLEEALHCPKCGRQYTQTPEGLKEEQSHAEN